MRDLTPLAHRRDREVEKSHYGCGGNHGNGCFRIPSPIDGQTLAVVASNGGGWDHVSVSRSNRCPNWPEMEHIQRMFFKDDEDAMQLHVPIDEHLNMHPHCLHLWRPQTEAIPRPPAWMVAVT